MNRKKQLIALILTFVLAFSCLPANCVIAANYTFDSTNTLTPANGTSIFAGDTLTNDDPSIMKVDYYNDTYTELVKSDNVNEDVIYTVLDAQTVGLTAPAGTEFAYWAAKNAWCSGGDHSKIDLIANWKAAAPTASLIPGSAAEPGDTVTLNLTTGGSIHYTTDGTTPTTGSALYVLPIDINAGGTIKAFSVMAGYPNSDVVTFTYNTVSFDANGGNTEAIPAIRSVASGSAIGILPTAPTRSGYNFAGWNTMPNGSGTAFTAATPVSEEQTVYAQWSAISSGDSGSGNSTSTLTTSYINTTLTAITNTKTASPNATSTVTTGTLSDSNGKAFVSVTESQVKQTVNKAIEAPVKQGEGKSSKVEEFKITFPAKAKTVEISLAKAAVTAVVDNNIDTMTIVTPETTITFDKASIATISKEALADVKISASRVDVASLSETVKTAVGDRPVFDLSVTSGDKTISQFGGTVTVSVPYTPKVREDINAIIINYINAEGELEVVKNCAYNKETGMITFKTNHFSKFAVGYHKVSFKDVTEDAWCSDVVNFLAARGIAYGSSKGNFSPTNQLTRGELLVMVMRAYDVKLDESLKDNFADAGNTYYTCYLAVAKKLGVTEGIKNNKFEPNKKVTRQEMVSLLYDILKQIGQLPTGTTGNTLTDYRDADDILNRVKRAMILFVETGIIKGSDGKLNPISNASKAQMAKLLYNLLSK